MDGTGFVDILIFAMIALFLVFRLRSTLGRRTGHERPPENASREAEKPADAPARLPDASAPDSGDGPPPVPRSDAGSEADTAPASSQLAAWLTELKVADPGFDETAFLDGARAAFEIILDAFAKGDRDRLAPLLLRDLFDRFAGEIDRREARGETLESALVSFVSAEIVGAAVRGNVGGVTVRFVTDQMKVMRNEEGEVVSGDEGAVSRVVDLWSFTRDIRSDDPNWRLGQTRSGR